MVAAYYIIVYASSIFYTHEIYEFCNIHSVALDDYRRRKYLLKHKILEDYANRRVYQSYMIVGLQPSDQY